MVTFAVAAPVPPTPLQLSVKAVALLIPAIASVPLMPRVPVQPPEATQLVASVDDQVSVVPPPLVTLLGVAVSVTVGAGETVTLAVAAPLPPAPEHVSVNADDIVSAVISSLPEVGREPDQLPEAVQAVASVVDHIRVVVPLLATALGVALRVTVGLGKIATLAVAAAMPLAPVQVSV